MQRGDLLQTLHQYVLRNKHFTAHSQGQILFGRHSKFLPCKDESTLKGYYFFLASVDKEYDVTAIFVETSYLRFLLPKRQIKRPMAPLLWTYQKLLMGKITYSSDLFTLCPVDLEWICGFTHSFLKICDCDLLHSHCCVLHVTVCWPSLAVVKNAK